MKQEMSVVGIDIAKRVFYLVGMDARGQIVLRKRCRRGEVLPWMANRGPVAIGMEACGAHYWPCDRVAAIEATLRAQSSQKCWNRCGVHSV